MKYGKAPTPLCAEAPRMGVTALGRITDKRISRLLSHLYLNSTQHTSVIVITFMLAQSDSIKRRALFCLIFSKIIETKSRIPGFQSMTSIANCCLCDDTNCVCVCVCLYVCVFVCVCVCVCNCANDIALSETNRTGGLN
jgi:hypothetical protein